MTGTISAVAARVLPFAQLLYLLLGGCGVGTDASADATGDISGDISGNSAGDGSNEPAISGLSWVVPSAGLPAEVTLGGSNNNLDVAEHQGRVFLAFRTSENHFASPGTVLWVVSSDDQSTWRHEGHFAMGTDLREPRFLAWQGRLWLYFGVLGKDPADFEPQGARAAEYKGVGQWDGPKKVLDLGNGGFIPWRIRVLADGRPVMIGYDGGENVYASGGGKIRVQLLTTSDGWTWTALVPGKPVVREGGGSEADFAIEDDGALVAVIRNEAGEIGDCHGSAEGVCFGAWVCRAEPGAWADWTCTHDPRKYDSPLMLRAGGQSWLIGRRSLGNEGLFDLGAPAKTIADVYTSYQLAWWSAGKRCALWRVDSKSGSVSFVLDLPSAGDTCFASALPVAGEARAFTVYNYTSPLDDRSRLDIKWLQGQLGQTRIYRARLDL